VVSAARRHAVISGEILRPQPPPTPPPPPQRWRPTSNLPAQVATSLRIRSGSLFDAVTGRPARPTHHCQPRLRRGATTPDLRRPARNCRKEHSIAMAAAGGGGAVAREEALTMHSSKDWPLLSTHSFQFLSVRRRLIIHRNRRRPRCVCALSASTVPSGSTSRTLNFIAACLYAACYSPREISYYCRIKL